MSFDWKKVNESKQAYRRKLAALPIAEKLRLLDAMRERAVAIRGAIHRQSANVQEQPPDYEGVMNTSSFFLLTSAFPCLWPLMEELNLTLAA